MLSGQSLGASALAARKAVLALPGRDRADCMLHGNFDFALGQPAR